VHANAEDAPAPHALRPTGFASRPWSRSAIQGARQRRRRRHPARAATDGVRDVRLVEKEHAEGFYPFLPGMTRRDDGHYTLPGAMAGRFPLTFSLMADKPDP